MKRNQIILRALQALIVVQLLIGIFSVVTLSIGRAVAVFGSAALIYLGMTIIQQLVSIRELLTYNAAQGAFPKTAATSNPTVQVNPLKRFQERSSKAAKEKEQAGAREQGGVREQAGVREQTIAKEQTVVRERSVQQASAEDQQAGNQDSSGNVVYADRARGIPASREL
jgi:hypothetical protein